LKVGFKIFHDYLRDDYVVVPTTAKPDVDSRFRGNDTGEGVCGAIIAHKREKC